MDQVPATYEKVLRRLTLNDEDYVGGILSRQATPDSDVTLEQPTAELVRLGALFTLDAADAAIHARVSAALVAGASREDVVGVLLAVAPFVGSARVVSLAPRVAEAIGYDVSGALEEFG